MKKYMHTLEKTDALHFVQEHQVGVLATVSNDAVPELSTIYFFTQNDFITHFVTKTQTRKYHNFLAKRVATLLVYDEEELASAELSGEVETVTDIPKAVEVIEAFQELVLARGSGYWVPPIAQLEMGHYAVCKLVPRSVRFQTLKIFSENILRKPKILTTLLD